MRDALALRGVECFLPLSRERHRWSDRIQLVEAPLFATYLFVRLPVAAPRPSVNVRGVVELVRFGAEPAPVGDAEVEALRRLVHGGVALERHRFLRSGQRVRIRSYGLGNVPTICATLSSRPSARRDSPHRSSASAISSTVSITSR